MLTREEILWYQKMRTKWLQDEDQNTKFYHSKPKQSLKEEEIKLTCYEIKLRVRLTIKMSQKLWWLHFINKFSLKKEEIIWLLILI